MHHQHLTHRGVVWPLEIETPFLVGEGMGFVIMGRLVRIRGYGND
jgi:hypothetical protein